MSKTIDWNEDIHEIFNVDDNEVLHIDEIAKLTKMNEESVRRWCRTGKMASYCFGGKYIVVGSDFKEFMRKSKVKAKWIQQLEDALDE